MLVEEGIEVIVAGHRPHGDMPLILQAPHGLKLVTGDTSYAMNVQWYPADPKPGSKVGSSKVDTRGDVVSEVLFQTWRGKV